MQLPVPVCYSDPWPTEHFSALSKFVVYDARIQNLFSIRDRKAEIPKIAIWSMGSGESVFSSSCLLWDVLHVYHLVGVLSWNEAIRQMEVLKDHKKAKSLFLEAHKFFQTISESILPAWLPSCRMAHLHEKDGSLKTIFPPFLVGETWKYWSQLALAMVHRVMIDKARESATPTLVSKIALGGYNLLKDLPRTEQKQLGSLIQEHTQILKIYALAYWAKGAENSAESGVHGMRVKILKDLVLIASKVPGLENIKEEAANCEQLNNSVYFHAVPKENLVEQVLSMITAVNLTDKISVPSFM